MGGFLTIGYCVPLLFSGNFFVGDKDVMEGDKIVIWGIPY